MREARHQIMASARSTKILMLILILIFVVDGVFYGSDVCILSYEPCRFLIKNELLFVAEREIEVHIWKVVYYQVLSSLLMFSH